MAFPTSTSDASALLSTPVEGHAPVVRAGGTDLQHRRARDLPPGERDRPLVDLRDLAGLDAVSSSVDGLSIGARVRVADIAANAEIRTGWPAFAESAGDLATPQIRATATLGGNLLQRVRCWYFRNAAFACLKKGGSTCFAREGDHIYHSCFDLGPCVAPAPSTLGLALVAYEGEVELADGARMTATALYGDGSDARREHMLPDGALLVAVHLPPAVAGERAAYFRVASRAYAEWPLVDIVARLVISDGLISEAAIVAGGVAPVPLRLRAVEEKLIGQAPTEAALDAAAAVAATGANPLPGTRYKVDLVPPAVREALRRAMGA